MAIKNVINDLSKQGRHLPERLAFMKQRQEIAKESYDKKKSPLNSYVVEHTNLAIMLVCMQMTAAFLAECLNMLYLTGQKQTIKAITGFTTVKALAEIDNFYMSASQEPLFQKLTKDKEFPPINVYPKYKWENRTPGNKCLYFLNKVVSMFYKSVYFYFWPFLCLIMNYMAPRCDQIPELANRNTIYNAFEPSYRPMCDHQPSIFLTHLLDKSLFEAPHPIHSN